MFRVDFFSELVPFKGDYQDQNKQDLIDAAIMKTVNHESYEYTVSYSNIRDALDAEKEYRFRVEEVSENVAKITWAFIREEDLYAER